ncbi:MAG TPA: hypothetical protein VJ373_05920 [Desulfatiglandales bacterium]|nr:hypothetical protein [Desulfatiglandales bacterium]
MSRFARTIELEGKIPAVGASGVNVVKFKDYELKYSNGMPIRFVAFPFPVAGQPRAVHKSYVEGKDLLSGKPMMQAIIDALTKPLIDEEKKEGVPQEGAPEPRLLKPDTEDNLRRLFKDREWTDFNPIILPTEERVAAMLKGTSHRPDEVVSKMGSREMTVEKAAVYAVMAGAKPEYFPTILAVLTQAPSFGNSTSSMANMIVVNGPIRKELGINSGVDTMGPFSEANSVIGRTFTLAGKIMGDLRLNAGAYSTLGSNLQYNNVCIAENEEALPEGWEPLHVQMGFKPTDNVVTIGIGWSYISSVGEAQINHPPHMLIRDYMRSLTGMGATIVMDPTVAGLLKDAHGFKTKAELSEWLSKNVEVAVGTYWGNGVNTTANTPMAIQGLEPFATWLNLPPETLIKPFTNSRSIRVVVAGGGIQTTWFVTDFGLSRGILIDKWK